MNTKTCPLCGVDVIAPHVYCTLSDKHTDARSARTLAGQIAAGPDWRTIPGRRSAARRDPHPPRRYRTVHRRNGTMVNKSEETWERHRARMQKISAAASDFNTAIDRLHELGFTNGIPGKIPLGVAVWTDEIDEAWLP